MLKVVDRREYLFAYKDFAVIASVLENKPLCIDFAVMEMTPQ